VVATKSDERLCWFVCSGFGLTSGTAMGCKLDYTTGLSWSGLAVAWKQLPQTQLRRQGSAGVSWNDEHVIERGQARDGVAS
jgi:hypothetical protein